MSWYTDRPWLSSYAKGVPADIPEVAETLVDMLDRSVRRYRRRVALEFFGQPTTYAELQDQVRRAAQGLWPLVSRRRLSASPGTIRSALRALRITATSITSCSSAPSTGVRYPRAAATIPASDRPMPA